VHLKVADQAALRRLLRAVTEECELVRVRSGKPDWLLQMPRRDGPPSLAQVIVGLAAAQERAAKLKAAEDACAQ
jgi:hypothetical protein